MIRTFTKLFCIIIFLQIHFWGLGQERSIPLSEELRFGNYLMQQRLNQDAIYHYTQLNNITGLTLSQRDSVNAYLGKLYLGEQRLSESSHHYKMVSIKSVFFNEAQFFSAFNYAFLHHYDSASSILSAYQPLDSQFIALMHFEQAGIALLERDFDRFDQHSSNFKGDFYEFRQQELDFIKYKTSLVSHSFKSPVVAGFLSALIPGAGRVYVGKFGQGIMSLMICTLVGLQAREGYIHDGPQSVRFIGYTTAFSALYIANIWGSSVAAKFVNNEFNEAINHSILFDMHIPLRTIFR